MKHKLKIIILVLLVATVGWFLVHKAINYKQDKIEREQKQKAEQQITDLLIQRKINNVGEDSDPFKDKDEIKILLIGIDSRTGDNNGHCDVIQLLEINRKQNYINITAVPRGTYSPLKGTGHKPSDYYVSNACGLMGIEYGINQIEKILGQKADYVTIVGFSEALGIFRDLKLPTTETLQWLRNRQGFAIGEPQRAHNHSTFIKQMFIKYLGSSDNKLNSAWQYLIYKAVKTDLSFKQTQIISEVVQAMDLTNSTWRIKLFMRPIHNDVYDIKYDEENLTTQLQKISIQDPNRLPEGDYSGLSAEEMQKILYDDIFANIDNNDYVKWAFENNVWLQLDNTLQREKTHYKVLTAYTALFDDKELKEQIISDYIIEMETREEFTWLEKGKKILTDLLQ